MHLQDLWTRAHRQWRLAALLLVVTAVAALLTALVYRSQLDALRAAAGEDLAAIAALKAGDLAEMRQARLDEAALAASPPLFNADVAAWLAAPTPALAAHIRESLAAAGTPGIYTNIALFDSTGQERLRLYPDRPLAHCAPTDELIARAYAAGTPQMGDLYRCTPGGPPQLDIAAPLLLTQTEAAAPIGTLLLAVDVPKVLTPILGRWPVPSASGEILLAERQDDTAVDLNGFTGSGSLSPASRYPITATEVPIVQAVLQPEGGSEGSPGGSVQGVDPQGAPVLAGLAAVSGIPWRIATQMHLTEVDAPLASRFGWYAGAAAGLVGLGVALVALLLQAHRQRTLRGLYEQVRQELKASEQQYQAIFNASPTPLSLSRPDTGRFVDVNQAFLDQFGYCRTELIGRTPVEVGLFSAGARAGAISKLQDAMIDSTEIAIRCKNGEIRDCLAAADVLDLPDGQFLLISAMDITARKQAEQAQAFLSALVTSSPDAIAGRDLDGRIRSWNPGAERLSGYTAAEAIGQPATLVVPPDRLALMAQAVEEIAQMPALTAFETQLMAKDGSLIDVAISVFQVHDGGGTLIGFGVILQDIRARKQAADALRLSEARLRAIVENTANTIWSVDRAYRLVVANAAFDRLAAQFGSRLAVGQAVLRTALPSASDTFWRAQYDRAFGGESFVIELNFAARRGIIFECQMNPIREHDGSIAGATVLAIDVTKQRQAAQLLQDTNAELERRVAARTAELQETIAELHRANAGKDAFMATVSHELRTPLTGILALSEVLQTQGRDPLTSRQAHQVEMIHAAGVRLLDTVNGVLLYTSLAGGRYPLQAADCLLAGICAETILALRAKADAKGQHVDLTVMPPDLAICSDASAIAKILYILLDNAVKFTPQGGSIGITAGVTARRNGELDTVSLAVWDTGIGIPFEQQPHLFTPFAQVDQTLARSYEGLGVGLASADQLAILLGGRIAVHSEPGHGTRFTVTLPVTPPGT